MNTTPKNKRLGFLMLLSMLCMASSTLARAVSETYRGRVIREELVRTDPIVEKIESEFVELSDDGLKFRVSRSRRTVRWFKAYHEKMILTRNPDDPADSGFRELVPGKELAGDLRSALVQEDLGPMRGVAFRLPDGKELITDKDGMLVDRNQSLLRHFDGLRATDLDMTLTTKAAEKMSLTLSRSDLWRAAQSAERLATVLGNPRPGQIRITSQWDRPTYRPGDHARLTVTVHNQAKAGNPVGFVKGGRAMSRHAWLDGPLFYFRPVAASDSQSFTREFLIPKDFDLAIAHLRIGFNEYSGSKPQHSALLKVRQ
jgi:hypothetical protein